MFRADVVVAGAEGRASGLALASSLIIHRPVIGWIHIDWREFSRFVSWRTRTALQLYRLATYIVAVSNGAMEGIRSTVNVAASKTDMIYNGIDVARTRELAEAPLPEHHRSWFDKPSIVGVGRLDH